MSTAGAGGYNGGDEEKGVVERVLDKRIVGRKVQYLIQAWETEINLRCPHKIAEFEKARKERENKKSEEVTSHRKDGAPGIASNSVVRGCNQNREFDYVVLIEDPKNEITKTGKGKELETKTTSLPTATMPLPFKWGRKNEESKESLVWKDRVAGIVSSNVSGGSGSNEENFKGKGGFAKDKDIESASGGSKIISIGKELETKSTSSSTVTKTLPLNQRRKNEASKEATFQTMWKDRAAGIVFSNISGARGSNEQNFPWKRYASAKDTERATGGSKIISSGKKLESEPICSPILSKELEALLDPVILTNLFSMIPTKQLATYRLVCKTWEENSRLAWRSSSTLSFLYSSKRRITLSASPNSGPKPHNHVQNATTLPEFLKFWNQGECNEKPYRQFHLKNWKLFEPIVDKAKSPTALKGQINRFWNTIGTNVTVLTMTNCEFSGPAELRKILFQSCPNMKILTLHNCTSLYSGDEPSNSTEYSEPVCGEKLKLVSLSVHIAPTNRPIPNTNRRGEWKWDLPVTHLELLSHFPSLTSLKISYPLFDLSFNSSDARKWMNAIKVIRRHDEHKLPLQQFNIDASNGFKWFRNEPVFLEYFKLLKELNLPILSLCINLGDHMADENPIKDLLLLHGMTLQTMTAKERVEWGKTFGFPYGVELDNLRTLYMSEHFCQNMEFIKYTPNLVELRIYERGYSSYCLYENRRETHLVYNTLEYELENFQLVTLRKLDFDVKVSAADLMRLGKWLPNIKELSIPANDEHFGVICEQWRQLVHLHVIDVGLTDKEIVGTGLGLASGSEEKEIRAPITLLKGLKCLKFREGPQADGIRLTNLSAVNGFLVLPQLQILHFLTMGSSETMLGNATKEALCAKIPDCKLHWDKVRHFPCPCCQGMKLAPPQIKCDW